MTKHFSWTHLEHMCNAVESLGYVVAVLGPLAGILLVIFSESAFRLTGIIVIISSLWLALFHLAFAQLMHAFKQYHDEMESSHAG